MSDEDGPHPAKGLPLDKIEMLNEPLTTEEDYLNEACIKELEGVIRSMPEAHERLAGRPEWSTPWIVTDNDIVSNFAKCAVGIWCGCPPDLVEVVGYVQACLRRGPFKDEEEYTACGRPFRMKRMSLCEINKFLWDVLDGLPRFMAWNDADKHENWVDLSALLRNVCIEIRNERRHRLAFDIHFDRKYGYD